jgi:hypothetical protein
MTGKRPEQNNKQLFTLACKRHKLSDVLRFFILFRLFFGYLQLFECSQIQTRNTPNDNKQHSLIQHKIRMISKQFLASACSLLMAASFASALSTALLRPSMDAARLLAQEETPEWTIHQDL